MIYPRDFLNLVTNPARMNNLTLLGIQDLFKHLGGLQLLIKADAPDFTIVAATEDFYNLFALHPNQFVNVSLHKVIEMLPNSGHFSEAIAKVVEHFEVCYITQKKVVIPQLRFDFPMVNGVLKEMYWEIQICPVFDEEGTLTYLTYTARDITDRVVLEQNYEAHKRDNFAFETFKGSPTGVMILLGPELRIAFANAALEKIWKRNEGYLDKPISEVFPELESQGFLSMLSDIYRKGDSTMEHEAKVMIERNGQIYRGYYDFMVKPFFTDSSRPHVGLLIMVSDITEKVEERIQMNLRSGSFELTEEVRDFGVFTIDFYTRKATFSSQIINWLGDYKLEDIDELFRIFQRDDYVKITELIDEFNTGKKVNADLVFRMVHPFSNETHYLRTLVQLQELNSKGAIVSGIIQDITHLIQSKKAIHTSAHRLKSVIEAAPYPIAIYTGSHFIFELANNALLKYFDKSIDDIGKPCKNVFPIYSKLGLLKKIEKVWNTGNSIKEEDVYIEFYRQGELVKAYLSYNLTPLLDENGNIYGVLHTTFDVTAVNMSKAIIEENENRYRTFIEEAPFATALYMGPDLYVTYANSLMLDVLHKDTSILGKPLVKALPEIINYPYYDILMHVYTTGQLYTGYQHEISDSKNPNLPRKFVNFQYKALMNKEGQIYGILHTAWDVTSEVIANRLQEENQKNFRNMIMQAPIAIMILRGQDMLVELVNPVMIDLLNLKLTGTYKKPAGEIFKPFNSKEWHKTMLQLYMTGNSFTSDEEEYTISKNGEEVLLYLRFNYEPMRNSSGEITGIMVVTHDITQQVLARKKIEYAVSVRTEELANANAQLKISNSQLEQFAYIASHDLQEPLRKISLFNQLLNVQLSDNEKEKVAYYMERINNSVQRMTNLIRDILGYSQLSIEQTAYEKVNLDEILEEVKDEFDVLIAEKKAVITAEPIGEIDGVRLQLLQLFQNLISNSLKYVPQDRNPVIHISVKSIHEAPGMPPLASGYCHLKFTDNGIGFDQAYADKIFTIFQRLHGKTQYEGTGIGLAMCKKIVENHHGLLFATGQVDQGAQFDVYLPWRQYS